MEILQGLIPILLAISLQCRADKPRKTSKADVKRDVGYGIQAIPGVAVHAPLASHGAHYPAGVVPQLGFISNTHALDSIGGFTSHGGYGVYPIIATPVVNVQGNVKGGHELDQGWRGIPSSGYGSVKHGHEIAQSLSKSAIPVQENQYDVPIYNFVPAEYSDVKGRQASAGYNHNALVPAYHIAGLTAHGKGLGPIAADGRAQVTPVLVLHPGFQGHPIAPQGAPAPKGYTFSTYHTAPAPAHKGYSAAPVNHHIPGHQVQPNSVNQVNHQFGHKPQLSSSGHGSISHGHQIAKTVHAPAHSKPQHKYHNTNSYNPSQRSTFTSTYHGSAKHNTPKKLSSGNSYQNYHRSLSEPKKLTSGNHYNNHQHVEEQSSYRHSSLSHDHVPAHLYTSDAVQQHDSSNYASSAAASDYGRNAQQHTSSELDSGYHPTAAGHTNGHGGGQHTTGDQKATSFQSFVIHTYPSKKQSNEQYNQNNYESEENFSANNKYDSGRSTSAESQYQN